MLQLLVGVVDQQLLRVTASARVRARASPNPSPSPSPNRKREQVRRATLNTVVLAPMKTVRSSNADYRTARKSFAVAETKLRLKLSRFEH